MDASSLTQIAVIFLALFLSAFFSGTETALFSLPKLRLQTLIKTQHHGKFFSVLLHSPRKLLITILISNMLVNIFSTTLAEPFLKDVFGLHFGIFRVEIVAIVIMTFAILIIGEILPKAIAIKKNESIAVFVAPYIWFFYKTASPIRSLVERLSDAFIMGVENHWPWLKKSISTKEELEHFIDTAIEQGILSETEQEFLDGFIDLVEKRVREIMTPRDEMEVINQDMPLADVMQFLEKSNHSRIPVYKDDRDNIAGILYVKDFLTERFAGPPDFDWRTLLRAPYYIPESKNAYQLFKDFKEKRIHIAIVVDEYGSVSGLITLEDIIKELITLPSGEEQKPDIRKVDDHTFILSARYPLEDFAEQFEIDIQQQDSVTVGGFLLDMLGRLPVKGEKIDWGNYRFIILDADTKHIRKLKIVQMRKDMSSGSDSDNERNSKS